MKNKRRLENGLFILLTVSLQPFITMNVASAARLLPKESHIFRLKSIVYSLTNKSGKKYELAYARKMT